MFEKEKHEVGVPFLFLALLFLCVGRLLLCSTSPPGGNQVDGLPPVSNTETIPASFQNRGVSDNRYFFSKKVVENIEFK